MLNFSTTLVTSFSMATSTHKTLPKRFRKPIMSVLLCALASSYWASWFAYGADDNIEDGNSVLPLKVSPTTCVALHKRQICRKTIRVSWSILPAGRYCIYESQTKNPLKCWQANALNSLAIAYSSATSVRYELRAENSDTAIAQATVKTAWVYNTSRRSSSGWRLF